MQMFFTNLLGWLPTPLQLVFSAVIAVFFLLTLLHLIRFILDIIPFV